jgi:hypothetical protein
MEQLEQEKKHYAILDSSGMKRGWIQYDVGEGDDLCNEQCVVAGRKPSKDRYGMDVKEYYILVVRPTGVDGEYGRVGVGLIQSDYVVRQKLDVRVV